MDHIRQILVGTDFGPDARHAIDWAGRLAAQLGARLLVVHVDAAQAVVPGSDLARREQGSDVAEMARTVAGLRGQGVDASGRVVPGEPGEELVALADELGADLVVVGTKGRSGLLHVLLGSVAERVLRKAGCPVLTVQSPGNAVPGGPRS